jgi:hypothetical protein
MPRTHALVMSLLALTASTACGAEYVYAPAATTSAQVAGRPAVDVAIPPEAPQGGARVATFGISSILPQQEGAAETAGKPLRALHLRMVVANNAPLPWTLDTREQRVDLPHRGTSAAAYASADAGETAPPLVTIPPASRRTVDLFFPLPADLQEAKELPAFDAVWTVHTDKRIVTERTPFERLQVEPQYAAAYNWDYWGPPYWYDPYYPRAAWVGATLPPLYVHRPVIVNRPILRAPPVHVRR